MESLYRKYRPTTFDEVVGQQHVVETLKHAVLEGRTSHAYLFCGPRGTGKTTMARILAKALECEQGPGHLPDGTCEQCRLIAEGEHPDVYELDAASRTGVDNVREEIINRVNFAPVRGRYKVYIIDEVHMLTTAAFNALLKTLEEPPEHVVFILCTTDPQKIPETILSRVQRFDFHAIGNDLIQAHLEWVCQQEGFQFDPAALELVVRHARGGMRDALSELEQLSVFGEGSISLEAAQDMLGEVAGSTLEKVSRALAERDVPVAFEEVGTLVEAGRDLLQFSRELAGHLRDVYVVAAVGAREGVVDAQGDELERLKNEATLFGSVDRVSYALRVLSEASNQMRTAVNQRLVLEVALTRICRPKTDLTLESLADRVASLESQLAALLASGGKPAAAATGPSPAQAPEQEMASVSSSGFVPRTKQSPRTSQAVSARQQSAPQQPGTPLQATSAASVVASQMSQSTQAGSASTVKTGPKPMVDHNETGMSAPAQPRQTSEEWAVGANVPSNRAPAVAAVSPNAARPNDSGAITDPGELQRKWKQVVDTLKTTNPSRGSLLMSTTILSDDGAKLTVNLPKGSAFAVRMLDRKDVRSVIDPEVARVFGSRSIVYVESSLQGANIARAQRAVPSQAAPVQAPQLASEPVRPAQPGSAATHGRASTAAAVPVQPARPVAAQESRPASAPLEAATPRVSPQGGQGFAGAQVQGSQAATSAPSAPEYPMPWDAWDAGMPPQEDDPYAEEQAPFAAVSLSSGNDPQGQGPAPMGEPKTQSQPSSSYAQQNASPQEESGARPDQSARVATENATSSVAQPRPSSDHTAPGAVWGNMPAQAGSNTAAGAPSTGSSAKAASQAPNKAMSNSAANAATPKKTVRRVKGEPLPAEAQKVYDMLTEVFGDCQLIDVEPASESDGESPQNRDSKDD